MTKCKVSVAMPAYNAEKYISEAIESILAQTFGDFEFIIINDGSTDNTVEIVQSYKVKDPRIKFYDRKQNKGIIYTANEYLDFASGEYIARMDADDVALQTRLEKQVAYMDKNRDVGALGAWTQYFPGFDISKRPTGIGILYLLKDCPIDNPSSMVRTSVVKMHNIRYNSNFLACEDYEFWYQLMKVSRISNLQELLLMHRWHGDNISIRLGDIQQKNIQKLRNDILEYLTLDLQEQENIKRMIPNMNQPLVLKEKQR
jgi:glycosyltransferase involved in cell wall biosynthesis